METNKISEQLNTSLEKHLNTIPIPNELDFVVQRAIKDGKKSKKRMINMKRLTKNIGVTAAALTVGFVGIANFSPTFAKSMSDLPIIGDIINVVTFTQFDYHEDTYDATLNAPVLEGLKDKNFAEALNSKYAEENKALFEKFEADVATLESFSEGGHMGIDSGFIIKTNNDQILSIARYVVNTAGSSSTTMTFDTIDKENELLITLPSLFKDSSYIELISENIKTQMKERMKADENLVYWIDGEPDALDGFNKIDANQDFYISDSGKLVISFDKYMVGPGSIGIQEFEIPTEVIQSALVSNTYIK